MRQVTCKDKFGDDLVRALQDAYKELTWWIDVHQGLDEQADPLRGSAGEEYARVQREQCARWVPGAARSLRKSLTGLLAELRTWEAASREAGDPPWPGAPPAMSRWHTRGNNVIYRDTGVAAATSPIIAIEETESE